MMANSKTHEMIRGLGMGMSFLDLLIKETQKQGGDPELIQFLTRPRFAENLTTVVKTIIGCDWRIPASEMCDRAERNFRRDFEAREELIQQVRNLQWYSPLMELGIPFVRYNDDENAGEVPIPSWLRRNIDSRIMEYPMLVGKYIVVDIGMKGDRTEVPDPGDIIYADKIEYLYLAERRYFDFDK